MKTTTTRQINNGLRLGGGLGLFFVAAVTIGVTVSGLNDVASGHLRFWPDVAIATGLIGVAMVILIFTARIWILYIAGCLLVAIPKLLIVAVTGKSLYSHEPFSGLQAAELALFSLLSLYLIYRVTVIHKPSPIDRLAFTFFLLALVFGLSRQGFAIVAVWQVAGVAALWLAWFMSRKKRHRRSHWRSKIRGSTVEEVGSGEL